MQVTVRQQNSGATPLLTSIEELARTKPPWWQYPTRIGEDQGGMLTDGKVVPGKELMSFSQISTSVQCQLLFRLRHAQEGGSNTGEKVEEQIDA